MPALKNVAASNTKMRKMDNETYPLRRKVMAVIYAAKAKGYNLPRIEVRIVDPQKGCNCAGYAYPQTNIVHINSEYVNDARLTHVVLHEILHAIFGTEHDNSCFLMNPTIPKSADSDKSWEAFSKYF